MALRGDWSGVRCVTPLIHLLGRAYGLVNDIQGMRPDAASGHVTFVLSTLARELHSRGKNRPHDDLALETDVLERMLSRAMALHEQARPLAHTLGMRRFDAFTDERVAWLEQWSREISLARLAGAASRHRPSRPTSQYRNT
jgi:hypothetical protein